MTHPIIYAGSAAIGGAAFLLALEQPSPDVTAAQITAYGVIVLGIIAGIPLIFAAWSAARVASSKAEEATSTAKLAVLAAESAALLAQRNLDQVAGLVPVVAKIEGHVNSDKTKDQGTIAAQAQQLDLQREMIDELKAAAALLAQAKATTDLSNAIAQAAVAGATTPAVAPSSAPTAHQTATIATVTEAAKTIVGAVPQLDSIEKTGEATHEIVKKIDHQ